MPTFLRLPDDPAYLAKATWWKRAIMIHRMDVRQNDSVIYLLLMRYGYYATSALLVVHWIAVLLCLYADIHIPLIPVSVNDYVYDFTFSIGIIYGFIILPVLSLYGILLAVKNVDPNDYTVLEAKTIQQKEALKNASDKKRMFIVSLFFPVVFILPWALTGFPGLLIYTYGLVDNSLIILGLMTYIAFILLIGISYGPTSAFIVIRAIRNKHKGAKS